MGKSSPARRTLAELDELASWMRSRGALQLKVDGVELLLGPPSTDHVYRPPAPPVAQEKKPEGKPGKLPTMTGPENPLRDPELAARRGESQPHLNGQPVGDDDPDLFAHTEGLPGNDPYEVPV